ncbi:MAG: hypothetical protein ACLQU5_05475 [Isosphaeraceae bacterium]
MILPDHARFGHLSLGFLLALLVVVPVGVQAGTNDRQAEALADRFWRPGVPVSVAVRDGQAKFRVPASGAGLEVLVIVSALAYSPGPYPIRLDAAAATDAGLPDQVAASPSRPPKLRSFTPEPIREPAAGLPVLKRDFSLMVRDGDVASASNYLSVRGVLRAVGKRVQVYVASEDVGHVDPELLKDLVATFDDRIFPVAAASVGLARDVDGDGRFTVLLSSWLSRLGNGRNAVDGFVRVSDLDLAFSAPFGNRCDMMYLSTSLKPGPHLRTVLTHEYMHAVVFSGKCRQTEGVGPVVLEEEGWLDEALAHLAEDQQAFSRSNIDYRISAFLSQPERYQLVVADYYAANLFRSHGNRGSTYLFLRWCVDQYGPELMPALIHSRLRGTANLEDATGCSFAELFRRWSVALFMSGLDPASKPDQRGTYRSVDVRNPLEDWELAGPRVNYVAAGGRADCWSAAGTSSHFVVVRGSSTGAVEVTVSGPPSAELQVTAVPLPAGMAQLELSARATTTAADGDLRLRATIREQNNEPVRLTALAWEPLIPPADSHVQEFRHGQLDMLGIASSFGTSALAGGAALRSGAIRLKGVHPGTGPLIVKLVGTDVKGRRVAAWGEIDNLDPESETGLLRPLAGNVR